MSQHCCFTVIMSVKETLFSYLEDNNTMERYTDPELLVSTSEELTEYEEAIERCLLGDDPLEMAQEGWDVYRHCIELDRRGSHQALSNLLKQRVEQDFEEVGIDLWEAGFFKETRNAQKWSKSPVSYNGHTNSEYNVLRKEMWKQQQGDYLVYQMLMFMAEDLT